MPLDRLKRRDFITLLGGAAAVSSGVWPLAAHAQQGGRMRRIGVLVGLAADDPESTARLTGFRQGLERLGWVDGRNVRIDYRFASGSPEQARLLAKELVALQPDVLFAPSGLSVPAFQQESRVIPIVFAGITNPIGAGWVASLARPGGNITGLMLYEASITGKWLAMLKEIAPNLARVALILNSKTATFIYNNLHPAEAMAASLAIELMPTHVETAADIERVVASIAREPNGGLLLPPDTTTVVHRDLIIGLAARHQLPTIYYARFWVAAGSLMSYGVDYVDHYRQAAYYIDRILRGTAPADLPVQLPVKYETVLNLKTAKTLGLTVPTGLLVAADEVIE